MENSSLCRVCLEKGASVPIFETKDSVDPDVYHKLSQCVGEKIEDLHGFPRHICDLCLITLNTATRFIERYKDSQEILLKHLNTQIKLEIDDNNINDEQSNFDYEPFISCDFVSEKPKKELLDENLPLRKNTSYRKYKAKQRKCKKKPHSNGALISTGSKSSESPRKHKSKSKKKSKQCEAAQPVKDEDKSQHIILKSSSDYAQPSCLCEQCGAVFTDKIKLMRHMKSMHRDLTCPQCPEPRDHKYSQQSLREHIRITHSCARPFVCPICEKAFKLKKTLNSHHQVVHEGKKRTNIARKVCHLCNRDFCNKLTLELHIKSHTGERPEKCEECGKTFPHKQYLMQHMRLHTGEKPFKCPVCDKGFAQRCNMKSHIKHNHRISQLSQDMIETLSKSRTNYLRFMSP